jgi:hypothetical protein
MHLCTFNVRFGPLCRLKSGHPRGPRSAKERRISLRRGLHIGRSGMARSNHWWPEATLIGVPQADESTSRRAKAPWFGSRQIRWPGVHESALLGGFFLHPPFWERLAPRVLPGITVTDTLSIAVTFRPDQGYVGTAPDLRQPVIALSLGGLRAKVEALMSPNEVIVTLKLDRAARLERDRRRLTGRPRPGFAGASGRSSKAREPCSKSWDRPFRKYRRRSRAAMAFGLGHGFAFCRSIVEPDRAFYGLNGRKGAPGH